MKDDRPQTFAPSPWGSSFILQLLAFSLFFSLLLLGPMLLRRRADKGGRGADETLVIVTPHNEATRYEFARAFREAHFAKTGRSVFVDWRTAGGTSEIARYVAAQYFGSFRDYWTHTLHRDWTPDCASFDDAKAAGSEAMEARKAFLGSNAGCGIDLFFGGGSFDYIQMAAAGRLVDCGVVAAHPELFALSGSGAGAPDDRRTDANQNPITQAKNTLATMIPAIPQSAIRNPQWETHVPRSLNGEPFWDPKGRWIGVCLGAFGICYNTDSIARLGIAPPAEWADLGGPRYADELALADPAQSGSVAKAFEMIMQQQIAEAGGDVSGGWLRGLRLIQRISANARYFTGEATEIPYSVQSGNAAAGMCIDFYGRFESEAVREADGKSRLVYVTPKAGSSTGADSIGLFRGAPHAALGREFIEYVMSQQGQKLWCFRAGAPGGPEKYTLRRLPIRPDLYAPQWRQYEADPEVDPYAPDAAGGFVYHAQWTGSLFGVISFVIRTAFIDSHDELKEAWKALIDAGFPPRATAVFSDMSAIDYAHCSGAIRDALRSPDKLNSVVLARDLDEHFREQYREAAELARRGM